MKKLLERMDTIISLLLADRQERKEEREAKQREENEKLLIEYAKEHNKRLPAGNIVNGREASERLVHSDGDLIPYGLSELDKAILEDFYRR